MNRQHADWVAVLLARVVNDPSCLPEATTEFLERFEGSPGTGACICPHSPERVRETADRWNEPFETVKLNMLLDHRCPRHGEKVQSAIWGRHKEKELIVTAPQWLSLGVTHKV